MDKPFFENEAEELFKKDSSSDLKIHKSITENLKDKEFKKAFEKIKSELEKNQFETVYYIKKNVLLHIKKIWIDMGKPEDIKNNDMYGSQSGIYNIALDWIKKNADEINVDGLIIGIKRDEESIEGFIFEYNTNPSLLEKFNFQLFSKIDRTTSRDILPMMFNKALFLNCNLNEIPQKNDIIKAELEKRKYKNTPKKDIQLPESKYSKALESIMKNIKQEITPKLTFKEEMQILSKYQYYKTEEFIIRNFDKYAIALPLALFNKEDNQDETPELIKQVTKRIKLSTLGHKIAMLILSQAYLQKKNGKGVVLPKEEILSLLGYSPKEKQIYNDIADVIYSLRHLDFLVWGTEYTKEKKKPHEKGKHIGNFIYNVHEDSKTYILDVNESFLGCIYQFMLKDNKIRDFSRGYFNYPLGFLALARSLTPTAYNLADFLIRENGNDKLNTEEYKVIAYKVNKYIEIATTGYQERDKQYKRILKAFVELKTQGIIEKTKPSISTLSNINPMKGFDEILHIYISKGINKPELEIYFSSKQ